MRLSSSRLLERSPPPFSGERSLRSLLIGVEGVTGSLRLERLDDDGVDDDDDDDSTAISSAALRPLAAEPESAAAASSALASVAPVPASELSRSMIEIEVELAVRLVSATTAMVSVEADRSCGLVSVVGAAAAEAVVLVLAVACVEARFGSAASICLRSSSSYSRPLSWRSSSPL